jgi:hypothetical protein
LLFALVQTCVAERSYAVQAPQLRSTTMMMMMMMMMMTMTITERLQ